MEKTLTIDGRQIKFKSSGGNIMRYRNQFNTEYFVDLMSLSEARKNPVKYSSAALERIIWALAKTADDSVPDPQTWYDSFEVFPFKKVFEDLSELIAKASESYLKNE